MEKITKKKLIELLCNNGSVLCGGVFRKSDEWIISAMEKIKPESVESAERRTVTGNHAGYIEFSGGSRLGFDQSGKHECFEHRSGNGVYFIVYKTTIWDEFDEQNNYNYVVYAIPDLTATHEEKTGTYTTETGKTYKTVDRVPEGWNVIDGATAPNGFRWISNGKPRYIKDESSGGYRINPDRKIMLLKSMVNTENFELFFGCLGNGTTVCNKAVEEYGDYKTIAHISEGGNIRLYVDESYIPAESMEKIKAMAERDAAKFQKWFESLSAIEQYGKILDRVPTGKFNEYVDDKRSLGEKLPAMREYFYTIA